MKREKCFAYLRREAFTVSIGSNLPVVFPVSYTLEEALEDLCDTLGYSFIEILVTLSDDWDTLGSGTFLYSKQTIKTTKSRIYAYFHGRCK